ncbi:hypothetical protein [Alistipes putredinis]|uniref:hypothetical protein n=1 Tax=Alistipes putredinis TaxID=28117 RepID=UPI003AABEDC4
MVGKLKWFWLTGLGVLRHVGRLALPCLCGCDGGTCLIISSPVLSVLWGAVMGGLLFSMFQKEK